jgi:hypothetical protein
MPCCTWLASGRSHFEWLRFAFVVTSLSFCALARVASLHEFSGRCFTVYGVLQRSALTRALALRAAALSELGACNGKTRVGHKLRLAQLREIWDHETFGSRESELWAATFSTQPSPPARVGAWQQRPATEYGAFPPTLTGGVSLKDTMHLLRDLCHQRPRSQPTRYSLRAQVFRWLFAFRPATCFAPWPEWLRAAGFVSRGACSRDAVG